MPDAAQGSEACEFPDRPNDPELVKNILENSKTVAVVGLSHKENRDSYRVAAYLKEHGYKIVPVNPAREEILGEKCYKTVGDIPFKVDVVDVFRKPSALPELAEQIAAVKPGAVWFQIGVVNEAASKTIRDAGIDFVQNLCMMVEHSRILRGHHT
ncbi:MAG: CoA-binding protein [Nitrospinota bacterium]